MSNHNFSALKTVTNSPVPPPIPKLLSKAELGFLQSSLSALSLEELPVPWGQGLCVFYFLVCPHDRHGAWIQHCGACPATGLEQCLSTCLQQTHAATVYQDAHWFQRIPFISPTSTIAHDLCGMLVIPRLFYFYPFSRNCLSLASYMKPSVIPQREMSTPLGTALAVCPFPWHLA